MHRMVYIVLIALFICMHRMAHTYRSVRTACIIIRTGRIVCIVCFICINCVVGAVRASLTVCNGYIVHVICIYACMQVSQCSLRMLCIVFIVYIVCMVLYGFVP